MATKANPGRFDGYAKAEADEPLFVLLARDPLAPFLVSIWSSLRNGDFEAAGAKFDAMLGKVALRYGPAPDVDKASEALDCAFAMFDWVVARRAATTPSMLARAPEAAADGRPR